MTNTNRFPQISPSVLNALDRDFPGWQDLVPTERDSELNEDSLITLIKSRKRAEIYREVSDKRKVMWAEMLGNSEKSAPDLIHEFAIFNWERMNTWASTEKKLSTIALEFAAKSEPMDVEGMDKSLDVITNNTERGIDTTVDSVNTGMNNYLNAFFSKDVNGTSRVGSDELKGFLRGKVGQVQEEYRQFGNQQKTFLKNSVNKLMKSKLEKIKTGELPPNAINRSDFFTDEEIQALAEEQERIIEDAFENRKKSNINTVNEMSQKFVGVSGKENILQKLNECPESIVSPELKTIISEAMDRGFMLEESAQTESATGGKTKRSVLSIAADVTCIALDSAAFALEQMADPKVTKENSKDKIYNFCNYTIGFWAHLITAGFCTGYTVAKLVDDSKQGKPTDYKAIANILSGISFVIGCFSLNSWKKVKEKISSALVDTSIQMRCDDAEKVTKLTTLSSMCSAALFAKSTYDSVKGIRKKLTKVISKKH